MVTVLFFTLYLVAALLFFVRTGLDFKCAPKALPADPEAEALAASAKAAQAATAPCEHPLPWREVTPKGEAVAWRLLCEQCSAVVLWRPWCPPLDTDSAHVAWSDSKVHADEGLWVTTSAFRDKFREAARKREYVERHKRVAKERAKAARVREEAKGNAYDQAKAKRMSQPASLVPREPVTLNGKTVTPGSFFTLGYTDPDDGEALTRKISYAHLARHGVAELAVRVVTDRDDICITLTDARGNLLELLASKRRGEGAWAWSTPGTKFSPPTMPSDSIEVRDGAGSVVPFEGMSFKLREDEATLRRLFREGT